MLVLNAALWAAGHKALLAGGLIQTYYETIRNKWKPLPSQSPFSGRSDSDRPMGGGDLHSIGCHKALLAGGLIQTFEIRGHNRFVTARHKALLAGGLIQTSQKEDL